MIIKTIKVAGFGWIFGILFTLISEILGGYGDTNFQQSACFFEEPKNSLDAVYIGASPTFTSWIAPLAYGKYNITMRTFANNNQPFVAAKSFIQLARKKHPNAVYLIAINGVYDDQAVELIHSTTDYFPVSVEKMSMIHQLCKDFGSTFSERVEILFPIVRYHPKWTILNRQSFHSESEPYKGGYSGNNFLGSVEDISKYYSETSEQAPLPDFAQNALLELIDYCKSENVKAVFVLSAQYRSEQTVKWYNTIIDEVHKSGFPILDEMADFDEIGLNETTDFYNRDHTNIHGALKITDYLSRYLIENYDIETKRDNPDYASWDEAYELYSDIVRPYLTEDELDWLQ